MNLLFKSYLALISKLSQLQRGNIEPISCTDEPVVWFHGASIGELESLWLSIQNTLQAGHTIILTIFSPSGFTRLAHLVAKLGPFKGRIHYLGLLPLGHALLRTVERIRVEAFFTTHYDLWPELLYALSQSKTPLTIVDARFRRSLRIALASAKLFKFPLPSLKLQATNQKEASSLRTHLPSLRTSLELIPHPRILWIKKQAASIPKSIHSQYIGVLGNIWPSDWKYFESIWLNWIDQDPNHRLILVPHALETIPWFKRRLHAIKAIFDVQIDLLFSNKQISILNAYGKLLKAYTLASWAYVGGGKEKGTHSVLEPLALDLPTACVPYRLGEIDSGIHLLLKRQDMITFLNNLTQIRALTSPLKEKDTQLLS